MRTLTMLAASSQHPRGRLEEIWRLSVYARLWSMQTSWTWATPSRLSVYNFGAVSPTRENSSSRPAPCFLLSKRTKTYAVPVVSDAKTDAEFVHQISTVEADLTCGVTSSYVIIAMQVQSLLGLS